MRLLLDTHVLLWWFTDDIRLSVAARQALADPANLLFASAASAWEVATKQRLGKLTGVPEAAARWVELLQADGIAPLPVNQQHALRAGSYAQPHRDPFDRMLAAQSEIEDLTLVTADPELPAFGCKILWAGSGLASCLPP